MMSPGMIFQKPYIIAPLPTSMHEASDRYHAGEVFGISPGSRKRKRSELVVGIAGEGVNLYDILSSKLVTSYALPPQSTFTCPPCSCRTRLTKDTVCRMTYVCTKVKECQVLLFVENTDKRGLMQTSMITHNIEEPAVFTDIIQSTEKSESRPDLLVVQSSGQIQCLHADTLENIWTFLPSTIWKEAAKDPSRIKVEYAYLTDTMAMKQGALTDRPELYIFHDQQQNSEESSSRDVLILVTTTSSERKLVSRTLHFLSIPRQGSKALRAAGSAVSSILAVDLPMQDSDSENVSYRVNVASGELYQVIDNKLTTFDIRSAAPVLKKAVENRCVDSLLSPTSTSLIISSGSSLTVYNTKYGSIMGSLRLDDLEQRQPFTSLKRKREVLDLKGRGMSDLITYFPKSGILVSIMASNLVGVQIQSRHINKSNISGLLIDSIGCSGHRSPSVQASRSSRPVKVGLTAIAKCLPDLSNSNDASWAEMIQEPERLYAQGSLEELESYLCSMIQHELGLDKPKLKNGRTLQYLEAPKASKITGGSHLDPRWVYYALGKIFGVVQLENEFAQLRVNWYPDALFAILVEAGALTIANVELALAQELRKSASRIAADQLIRAVVELDPEMQLLLGIISHNHLDTYELLRAVRALMESLTLITGSSSKRPLLMNGESPQKLLNGDKDAEVTEQAEEELEVAEYSLGPGAGIKGEALSLALSKLYTCSSSAVVFSLQQEFTNQEIVSLIYLLRVELVRGSWTSKYMDVGPTESLEDETEVSDSAIVLMASLLNNCIDAIGAGGWLSGSANLIDGESFDSEDLIMGLKLEVTAALDGIEEFVYLEGLTSEMIRFGNAVQQSAEGRPPTSQVSPAKAPAPITIPFYTPETSLLPMGMKTQQDISRPRIGIGGEVHARSKRDIGRLKSRTVGQYTLEKIVI